MISFRLGISNLYTRKLYEYGTNDYVMIKNEFKEALYFNEKDTIAKCHNILLLHNLNDIQLNYVFEKLNNDTNEFIFSKKWSEINKWLNFAYNGKEEEQISVLKQIPYILDKRIEDDYKPIFEIAINQRIKAYEKFRDLAFKKSLSNSESKEDASLFLMTVAMKYLFEELNLNDIDRTKKTIFIESLRGKSVKKPQNTNTYKILSNPILHYKRGANDQPSETLLKNLVTLKSLFESLGLDNIVEQIAKEIGSQKYKE